MLPPGPSSHPIVNLVRWLRTPLPLLEQLAATYGSAFSVRIPRLPEPFVFFSDPAAIKDIWSGDPDVLRAGDANALLRSALGPSSLLLLDGQEHLRERRLMLPPFHGDRMRAYGDAMRSATLAEIARWKHGVAFPVHGAMQTVTLEVIMRTIFGVGDESRLRPLRDALVRYTTLATSRLGTAVLMLTPPEYAMRVQQAAAHGLGRLLPWSAIVRAQSETDRIVREVIAARRREGTAGRSDVLSLLLDARDEHGAAMTDDELRDEMLTLLIAGHETTATTLAWVIHHLLAHPSVLARLRIEIDEAGDDVERLALLDAVIKETLRLTPIIPLVARRLARAATIGGHALPAGATAAAVIYLVHRRPDLWPDPARFDPTRFLGKKPDPSHYFPFGGGTRRCLGMAFASFEMKIVLATILARFDLAAASDRVRLVRRGVTLAPSAGMPIVARPRQLVARATPPAARGA
jgi:cytochrome P450